MKYYVPFLVVCIIALSCKQDSSPQSNSTRDLGRKSIPAEALQLEEQIDIEPPRTGEPPAPTFALDKGSKIIRSGNMQYEVDDLTAAKGRVDQILSTLGAYYEEEAYLQHRSSTNYDLQIRILGNKFETLINLLEQGVGRLKVKNISANDVTEEYVDLKIRLDNKLAVLGQYKSILKKASTIEEILTVNDKIRRLEEEIESKKGRMRFLDDRVQYAKLHLQLSQKVEVVLASAPGYGSRFGKAFMSGIHGFMSFVVGVVYIWPFLLWLVLIWIVWGKLRKRRKARITLNDTPIIDG